MKLIDDVRTIIRKKHYSLIDADIYFPSATINISDFSPDRHKGERRIAHRNKQLQLSNMDR